MGPTPVRMRLKIVRCGIDKERMQVPPNDNNSGKKIIGLDTTSANEASKLLEKKKEAQAKNVSDQKTEADSVNVSAIAQSLNSELNPVKMKEERDAYVAQIKKLYESGDYFKVRSTKDIAESFMKEIFIESQLAQPEKNEDEGLF